MPDPDADRWDAVAKLGDEADAEDVISAARHDLQSLSARIREQFDAALRFAVMATDFHRGEKLVVEVTGSDGHRKQVDLEARTILDARDKGLGPIGLLASAIASPVPLDAGWRPRRIGEAAPPPTQQPTDQTDVFRFTSSADRVDRALNQGRDVLVTGDHGSGRSALAAHFASQYVYADKGVVWLGLIDPADGPESIIATLLNRRAQDGYLLVIDGLHANLPVVKAVFNCVKRLRNEFGLQMQVLATGWIKVADLLQQGEQILDLHVVFVEGRETIRVMLNEVDFADADARGRIERLVGGDVHMAATALQLYRVERRVPTIGDLQRVYTGNTQDRQEQHALYHLACLGAVGLAMSCKQAESVFGPAVGQLHAANLVHRTDDAYMIGPRRRAEIVMQYAVDAWQQDHPTRPEDVIWRHLQRGGSRAIRAMLNQLDHFVRPDELRRENLMLLSTWDTLEQLAGALESKIDDDPSWEDNLGAAVFAAMALARLRPDDHERWQRVAGPIRERWRVEPDARRPEPVGVPTEDYADFIEIAAQMQTEDEMFGPAGHPSKMPADSVDQQVAYRNWVLGLLLGLEATAPPKLRDEQRLNALVAMAGRAQERDGSYYPQRVPWVTARVLIGLCQADQRYNNSRTVLLACRWLLDQLGGEPGQSWWRSGTGSWNSNEATTAMCLTGLYLAAVADGEAATSATAWLVSRESTWMQADREIDLANVLEALAFCAREPIQPHLKTLLNRMQTELRDPPQPTRPRPEERLRMPFITAQLGNLVWETVRTECRSLLREVLRPHDDGPAPTPAEPTGPAPTGPADASAPESPDDAPGTAAEPGARLTEHELRLWHDAAEQLRSTLIAEMNKRRGGIVSAVPAVRQALDLLRSRRDEQQRLVAALGHDTPMEVLRALDELGRTVCGLAWPTLPYPDGGES